MNAIDSDTHTHEATEERDVRARPGRPFDRDAAREAGLRSAEARREKARAREEAAQLDALAVSGRVSTALAREMTYEQIAGIIRALRQKAADGSIQAIRELRAWLDLAGIDGGPDDGDAMDWGKMSPEQRAAARAQLMRELAQLEDSPAQS